MFTLGLEWTWWCFPAPAGRCWPRPLLAGEIGQQTALSPQAHSDTPLAPKGHRHTFSMSTAPQSVLHCSGAAKAPLFEACSLFSMRTNMCTCFCNRDLLQKRAKLWQQKVTVKRKSTNYRRISKARNMKKDTAQSMAENTEIQIFSLSNVVFNVTNWREIQLQNK